MIETLTVPTARLSSHSRLLLDLGKHGGLAAFTEAQLVRAVVEMTRTAKSHIQCHGIPVKSGSPRVHVWRRLDPAHSPDDARIFDEACEWLGYLGIGSRMPDHCYAFLDNELL